LNGLYSEAAQEVDYSETVNHGPIDFNSDFPRKDAPPHIEVVTKQAVTLEALAALANMADRVDLAIDAYNEMANAIEEATGELQADITASDIYLSGVPKFWHDHVVFQRTIRGALVQSYRDLANELAATYGVR
jgi:hypothetical protein